MPPEAHYNPPYFGHSSDSEDTDDSDDEDFEIQVPEARVEEALKYLRDVRAVFSNNIAVYQEFLTLMEQFRLQRIHANRLVDRVVELFYPHPDIVIGLNVMLPEGLSLSRDEEGSYVFNVFEVSRTLPSREVLARQNRDGYAFPQGIPQN